MTEDQQEALSIYQALSLRLCLLSSGNWAVVLGPEEFHIMPTLDEPLLRLIAEAERARVEDRRAQARVGMTTGETEATLEELGL